MKNTHTQRQQTNTCYGGRGCVYYIRDSSHWRTSLQHFTRQPTWAKRQTTVSAMSISHGLGFQQIPYCYIYYFEVWILSKTLNCLGIERFCREPSYYSTFNSAPVPLLILASTENRNKDHARKVKTRKVKTRKDKTRQDKTTQDKNLCYMVRYLE